MISVEPHSWYIVMEGDNGWVFSQAYSLLGDCKIALGTDTLTRTGWGLYEWESSDGTYHIGTGKDFIENGFVLDNSTQENF